MKSSLDVETEPIPTSTKEVHSLDVYHHWRQKFVKPMLVGSLVIGLFALIPSVLAVRSSLIGLIFIVSYLVVAVITFAKFPNSIRMGTFLLIVYILGISELITHGILGDSVFFFLGLIIFSTMMLSPTMGIAAIAASLLTVLVFGILDQGGFFDPINLQAPPANLMDWLSASAMMLLFGAVIVMGFRQLEAEFIQARDHVDASMRNLREERINLDKIVQERTGQLKRLNDIGRSVTSILDPDELLASAVFLIGNEFNCYFTAIYLVEPTGQFAELREATGDAGRVLRENKHKLDLNGRSAIAEAISTRRTLISSESGQDLIHFENPILPYSKSHMVVPLLAGDQTLGALELHSTKEKAFAMNLLETYLNLANQVTIALENSRLFQEATQSLAELKATQRQYLQDAWSSLPSEKPLAYEIGEEETPEKEIEIPLTLRDQVIGQINMTASEEWTPEQKNLIETIAAQTALALENARLVEESQSIAVREKIANEIISKIWSSTSIDSILQTTVRELGRALEAAQVDIELRMGERYE
ncbi:MAG: GAF domain-containing protein [Chloroflexi bacterium]|nr:GAF domain-containing protein [Chloroflexota bacterium]